MNDIHRSAYAVASEEIEIVCGTDLHLRRVFGGPGGKRRNFEPGLAILILIPHSGAVLVKHGGGSVAVAESSSSWVISLERGASLVPTSGASYTTLEMILSSLECLAIGCGVRLTSFPATREHPSDPVLESSIEALYEHASIPSFKSGGSANFCRAMGTAIQYHILRTYAERGAIQGGAAGALAPWQLRAVKQAILSRLDTRVFAADLAIMCGISTSHLRRAFFASTGESLHRWSVRRRIDHACNDLATTSLPVAEIALRWGFSDQSHLTRTFASVLGATPAKWRRVHAPASALKLAKQGVHKSYISPHATMGHMKAARIANPVEIAV